MTRTKDGSRPLIQPYEPIESTGLIGQLGLSILDSLDIRVAALNPSGAIVAVNTAWIKFEEYNIPGVSSWIGANYLDMCTKLENRYAGDAAKAKHGITQVISGDKEWFRMEYIYPQLGGQRWVQMKVTPLTSNPLRYVVVAHQDITAPKEAENRLRYLGLHDSLTDVYSRAYCEETIRTLNAAGHSPLAIIMVDANGLKWINDIFGHAAGDKLLKGAANVLKESCREGDLVARWGGDEFLIVLPATTETEAKQLADRIQKRCSSCSLPEKAYLHVSLSIGAAARECSDQDIDEVIQIAESRMYEQKAQQADAFRDSLIASLQQRFRDKGIGTDEQLEHLRSAIYQTERALELSRAELRKLRRLAEPLQRC